jgi:tripartite-type tricarboxylate transporter receptor subunit TctC
LAQLVTLVSAGCAAAEPVADFYTSKQISMIVPSGVGGGYDLYGRFLARFIGRHIPGNPAVVVKNMPAAGPALHRGARRAHDECVSKHRFAEPARPMSGASSTSANSGGSAT